VNYFSTPDSMFTEADPRRLERYQGTPLFTTNEVLLAVSNMLHSLLKTNVSLGDRSPRLYQGGSSIGMWYPFYRVEWPHVTRGSPVPAADVHFDARSGKFVYLHLLDDVFFDLSFDEKLRRRIEIHRAEDPSKASLPRGPDAR
jgi:hypothetical protein